MPMTHEYRELVDQVHDCIVAHVPRGAVVLIASKGDDELTRIEGYRAWHFPRAESGVYAGQYPSNSVEAIAHLRQLFSRGAQYLVFPWTAHWWLDHYKELTTHLNASHALTVSRDEVCVIYELRESAAFDAFDFSREGHIDHEDDALEEGRAGRTIERLRLTLPLEPEPASMRVLTILARFGTEQYPHAEQEIADIFARQMPEVDRAVIVVDNALPREHVEIDERQGAARRVVLGGDNSAREFSAFDRALEFVGSDIWSYDLVHFATSAFNRLYVAYLERFDTHLLQALAGRAVCAGHIDCYNESVSVLTFQSQHWIRSCFFMLPPAEVKALGRFVSIGGDVRLWSGNPDAPFRADAPVSQRYREYITQWLTGGDIGQGVEWHSRFALTRETLPGFEQKAQTILNEQLLGIRLRALGCLTVDVTWLSAMLRHTSPSEIPWNTPWREQLALRDRDAIVLRDPRLESVGIAV